MQDDMYQPQDEMGQVYGSCVYVMCMQDVAVLALHAKLAPSTMDSMYVTLLWLCAATQQREQQ
jgi:hypothetical protein